MSLAQNDRFCVSEITAEQTGGLLECWDCAIMLVAKQQEKKCIFFLFSEGALHQAPSSRTVFTSTAVETFELERTLKGHIVQVLCNEQGHLQIIQVLRAPFSLAL